MPPPSVFRGGGNENSTKNRRNFAPQKKVVKIFGVATSVFSFARRKFHCLFATRKFKRFFPPCQVEKGKASFFRPSHSKNKCHFYNLSLGYGLAMCWRENGKWCPLSLGISTYAPLQNGKPLKECLACLSLSLLLWSLSLHRDGFSHIKKEEEKEKVHTKIPPTSKKKVGGEDNWIFFLLFPPCYLPTVNYPSQNATRKSPPKAISAGHWEIQIPPSN